MAAKLYQLYIPESVFVEKYLFRILESRLIPAGLSRIESILLENFFGERTGFRIVGRPDYGKSRGIQRASQASMLVPEIGEQHDYETRMLSRTFANLFHEEAFAAFAPEGFSFGESHPDKIHAASVNKEDKPEIPHIFAGYLMHAIKQFYDSLLYKNSNELKSGLYSQNPLNPSSILGFYNVMKGYLSLQNPASNQKQESQQEKQEKTLAVKEYATPSKDVFGKTGQEKSLAVKYESKTGENVTSPSNSSDAENVSGKKQREDMCAVVPQIAQARRQREDMCAVVPETAGSELVLSENFRLSHSRYVRAEKGGKIVTAEAEKGSVLAGVDAALEKQGLVPDYQLTAGGIMLNGIRGIRDAEIRIAVVDKKTGDARLVSNPSAESYNPQTERLNVGLLRYKAESDYGNFFNKSHFKKVYDFFGNSVEGGYELLRHTVTPEQAADSSLASLEGVTEKGARDKYSVRRNSHLFVLDSALRESGLTPEYEIAECMLKDGEQQEKAIYLKNVSHNGVKVMERNARTGMLNEIVGRNGERYEALAADGVTAIGSADARASVGQTLSIVGMVQGVYDRRKTNLEYCLRKAA